MASGPQPPFTIQHVEEWASFGSQPLQKPQNEQQLMEQKQRKQNMSSMKKRLLQQFQEFSASKATDDETTTKDPNDASKKEWSLRRIEMELNRLVALVQNANKDPRPAYQLDNNHPDNIKDHKAQGGPLLQYLWSNDEPLHGQTLYLGGEVGCDGHIYCIPGHQPQVLKIDTHQDIIRPIGPHLVSNGRLYKWLRGLVVGEYIYGLPCHAEHILRIHVPSQQVDLIDIPFEEFYKDPKEAKEQREMVWKYHGGAICPMDGCIYAIPQRSHHVLKINPMTNPLRTDKEGAKDEVSFVGPAFPGKCKWYGGILGKQDGAIYGIPQNASGVLRITPTEVSVHGQDVIAEEHVELTESLQEPETDNYATEHGLFGNHKWHGGAAAHNGDIVCVPANANSVLCITPGCPPIVKRIGHEAVVKGAGRHRSDGKYKFLGAMAGTNGKVYLFPCASEYALQVDTVRSLVKNVGPNLRDTGMENVHQNKWQNGLTCKQDNCVYGIPLAGHTLLRIDTTQDTNSSPEEDIDPIVTTWEIPSPRIDCRDKFEGGVILPSTGVMYTVPNNHKGVLRIEPFVPASN
eukprot:Nitzschia sp. Nitz4//scaffold357_size15932//14071//15789//NITZ4_008876-RA/size15932-processed-gene-0.28-mRNA-1//1//CDS//3329548986//5209//frame0